MLPAVTGYLGRRCMAGWAGMNEKGWLGWLLSGLRSAEVLGLRVADVDIGRGWVRVTGKTSQGLRCQAAAGD